MKIRFTGLALIALTLSACAQVPTQRPHTGPEHCQKISDAEVMALFERWNQSLQTGEPSQVAANYGEPSLLLPTLSNTPRLSQAEKEDYFHHFLANKPIAKIDYRFIDKGCNTALDTGIYTFTYQTSGKQVHARYTFSYRWTGNQWLISSHHSSLLPEQPSKP